MYRRIHADRHLREYSDGEGGWNLVARGTPDAGAEVRRTLDEIGDELFKEARRNGTREQREAYALDALVEMARRARGEKADAAKEPSAKYLGLIKAPTSRRSGVGTSKATSSARSRASDRSPSRGPRNCSPSRSSIW